jgi:hypothetical protein
MTAPSSFCTIATESCAQELIGLLLSLSVHHPSVPVVALVDAKTQELIEGLSASLRVQLQLVQTLNEYTGKDRKRMEKEGIWSDFQMMKSKAIDIALAAHADTMFLDSDILLLHPIDIPDPSKELGLSPHYIRKGDTDRFGYYNGGALWTRDKTVPEAWRRFTKTSRFYDQASIEDLAKEYSFFEFSEQNNMSWWRLGQSDVPMDKLMPFFDTKPGQVLYKGLPLHFVHTHFSKAPSDPMVNFFNILIMSLLQKAHMYKELSIIGRIMNGKWAIHVPKQPQAPPFNHTNDSFREELVLLYKANKDIELVYDQTKNLYLEPAVMLYDRDTINWFRPDDVPNLCKVYLGNCDMAVDGQSLIKAGIPTEPWIYWPRRPMIVEHLLGTLPPKSYQERPIETLFIGNFENAVQQKHRTSANWSAYVSEFHLTGGEKHKFTQKEYLTKLGEAKFGLCLRGYGVKCHREIELMAFGTPLLVTPDVNTTSYQEPLIEGRHFLYVAKPEDIPIVLATVSEERWAKMSADCKDWYGRNVHSKNMWRTFLDRLLYT